MALGWRGSYLRYKEFFLNVMVLYRKRADLRAFLEIILSLTTVTIFLVFAIKPTTLTIISLIQQIQEKKETVSTLDQKIQSLRTASGVFEQNKSVIPIINRTIPTLPNPDLVSKQIQGVSAKNSISLLGLSIGQATFVGEKGKSTKKSDEKPLPGDPQEMAISISAKGNYPNLIAFAKDMENLGIGIRIDTLGVNSSQTEAGQVIVVVISGSVPYLGN